MTGDHSSHAALAAAEIRRFADLVDGADPATPVPTCPGWTLADLLDHVGGIHRWATYMVEHLSQKRVRRDDLDLGLPDDPHALATWLAAGAEPLERAFRAADPDAPMWSWGLDKHARFWPRRMVHETTVHRADAELALGREPKIDPAVAADGIDELLDNIPCASSFAPRVDELRGNGEVLLLEADDVDQRWAIALEPDCYRWTHDSCRHDARARGSATQLLLVLYGRFPAGSLDVDGDRALLDFWLERSAL
jgi:uncharacterized protein (TIGR03083 family)